MMKGIKVAENPPRCAKGTAGLCCHASGQPMTVSAVANATGGIGRGHLIEVSN